MPIVLFRRNRRPQEQLTAPIGVRVLAVTRTSVTFGWTPTTTTHTAFQPERNVLPAGDFDPDEEGAYEGIGGTNATTYQFTDTNLQPNTLYYYRVRAIRGMEASPQSVYIVVRTLAVDREMVGRPILAGNARRQLQLAMFTRSGELVADLSPDLISASISTNEHGELALAASVRMHERISRRYTQPLPITTFEVNDGANTLWKGRAETLTPAPTTLDITGAGLWDTLNDLRYTAEWSRIDLSGWREVRAGEITIAGIDTTANDDYDLDIGGGISRFEDGSLIGPAILVRLNADQSYIPSRLCRVVVVQPHRSRTRYQQVDFFFTCTLSVNFQVRLRALSFDLQTDYQTTTIITGQGNGLAPLTNIQKGTISMTVPPCDAIMLEVAPVSAASYTAPTEDEFIRFEEVRVRATSERITPDVIARDILSMFRALSFPVLESETRYLVSSERDLLNESYSDASPLDILIYLAQTSDYLFREWQARVVRGYLRLEPLQPGRLWYLDEAEITQERPTSGIINRVYAEYNDNNGRTLRTAPVNDVSSQSRYEIAREDSLNLDTTEETEALQLLQVRLRDNARSLVRVKIGPIKTIFDSNNAASPLWLVNPNDRIVPRFLPMYDTSDPLYEIGIAKVEYDLVENTLTVETLLAPPELERILALQALAQYPEPSRT